MRNSVKIRKANDRKRDYIKYQDSLFIYIHKYIISTCYIEQILAMKNCKGIKKILILRKKIARVNL